MRTGRMLVFFVALAAATAEADDLTLQQCQKLQRGMDTYTERRRSGGSVARMESWKRSRQELKDAFRRGNCRKHRLRLE